MKKLNTRELIKVLCDNGYSLLRQNGKHRIYSNGEHKIPLPLHNNVNFMIAKRVLKEASIEI